MADSIEARLNALESALQVVQDELAITRLIASYGPLVDAGEAEAVAALWTQDGTYDVDEAVMVGRDQLAAMVRSTAHQGFIERGCAHFLGPAHVAVDGDSATAVCHSIMVVNEGGEFGADAAFAIRRTTAHHFALIRTEKGWRIERRTSRVLDGRAEAIHLLAGVVDGLRTRPVEGRLQPGTSARSPTRTTSR